jgi:hypothetical protein
MGASEEYRARRGAALDECGVGGVVRDGGVEALLNTDATNATDERRSNPRRRSGFRGTRSRRDSREHAPPLETSRDWSIHPASRAIVKIKGHLARRRWRKC